MTDWLFKIHAYLHDPPDKPFALGMPGGHEAWGRELARVLTGTEATPSDTEIIHAADCLAAGADRTGLLQRDRPSLKDLRHPLSGQKIDLSLYGDIGDEARRQAHEASLEEVEAIADAKLPDPAARFVALWGLLPARLRCRAGRHELGALWDWLPAETRMPNHPLVLHQSLTSALASILKMGAQPALLSFAVAPVQGFIAQARRPSDLWGGSALIARATLAGLVVLVEELGPDHVVFPSLRRSDLYLRWLLEESKWAATLVALAPQAIRHVPATSAALPNRFVAVVPDCEVDQLAMECEGRLRAWWSEKVAEFASELEERDARFRGFAEMARNQVDGLVQVSWAANPWPGQARVNLGDGACAAVSWLHGGTLPDPLPRFLEAASRQEVKAYKPNGGSLYGACYATTESLRDAVKRSRPVVARAEGGLKCSLCGERAVVPGKLAFAEQSETWRQVGETPGRRGDIHEGESLCGVCWAKRRFGRKEGRVPSTSEIAAAPFKQAVLERLIRPNSPSLCDKVRALCDSVERAGLEEAWVVPRLVQAKSAGGLAERFAKVDGEILLGHPRERHDQAEGEGLPPEVGRNVASLRAIAANEYGIDPPRPYLAALTMDGDSMGRWLSGEKNAPLAQYLSTAARDELRAAGGGPLLELPWPMTPAMHAAFSEACAVFSQRSAPRTLHDDLPAFLIYAGGDDVLALTPIGCPARDSPTELATEAALRLRLRFSGHVRREEGSDVPDAAQPSGFVLDPRDGLSLAFGKDATASAGLAIFHYKWPLGRALHEARQAEKYAKEALGRNALAISVLRRSGQITRTGLSFLNRSWSPVLWLQRLAHAFAFDDLSPRFVAEVSRRVARFEGGMADGELIQLATPLVLQSFRDHKRRGLGAKEVAEISESLDGLREAARGAAGEPGDSPPSDTLPADLRHLRRWIDLIECAAFLGRGVEP